MKTKITALLLLFAVLCSAQKLTTYTIQAGEQNFKPLESPLPKVGRSFEITGIFDSTAYYSYASWSFDKDWFDWNKLKGVTCAASANNKSTVMVGFRPSNIDGFMVVTPYINDRKERAKYEPLGSGFVVECNKKFKVKINIYSKQTQFIFEQGNNKRSYTYKFKRPFFPIWREVGTWMGGANNEPGRFGGYATQYMEIQARLK
jgi:hypothetical protein